MRTIEDAILLATTLHAGQKDKIDEPYILHPLRVMLSLKTEEERMVGMLHDVVEDCDISFDSLLSQGYSESVVQALRFVTKLSEEEHDYEAFIERILTGPVLAWRVKIADIEDNLLPNRFPRYPTDRDFKRREKYELALGTLKAELDSHGHRTRILKSIQETLITGAPFAKGTAVVPIKVPLYAPKYFIAWGTESITDTLAREVEHIFMYGHRWWVVVNGVKGMFEAEHFAIA